MNQMELIKGELSKLLPMVFKALQKDSLTKNDVASELGVYPNDINELICNLTIIPLNGEGGINLNKLREKSHLRIVK